MIFSEIIPFLQMLDKGVFKGKVTLSNKNIRSISAYSSKSIYYFPTIVSDQCTLEEVNMISKAIEKQYAAFVVACVSLIPFHKISQSEQGSIEDYLKIFHQNMGISEPNNLNITAMFESAAKVISEKDVDNFFERIYNESVEKNVDYVQYLRENYMSLNDMYCVDQMDSYTRTLYNRYKVVEQKINEDIEVPYNISAIHNDDVHNVDGKTRPGVYNAFDSKQVFTDTDMKKSNELVPTFTKANIGFIIEETGEVVTRDVLIGVKAFIHRMKTSEIISNFHNAILNKRGFLKFVKFVTGEERSLADLLFGIKELKSDVGNERQQNAWFPAFKRRKRWSKMTIPFIMKNYTPNGTVVITMNEVDFLRDQYGINILGDNHARMLMDEYFLLGFVILDQTNEIAYVMYDGHNYQFQEYPYALLEREMQANDRMMRELYRTFSSR